MYVIPGILDEDIMLYFDESTYAALAGVADDVICNYINDYMDSADANPSVKDDLDRYMGTLLKRYKLNKKAIDEDVLTYIDSLVPETLAYQNVDYNAIIAKLQFLEDGYSDFVFTIPPRTTSQFDTFLNTVAAAQMRRAKATGRSSSVSVPQLILDNSFLFYKPNAKVKQTAVSRISKSKRRWTLALNGAKYLLYCNENNIDAVTRRRF